MKEEEQRLLELTAEFTTLKRWEFVDPRRVVRGM